METGLPQSQERMLEAEHKASCEACCGEGRERLEEYNFKVKGGMVGDMTKSGCA